MKPRLAPQPSKLEEILQGVATKLKLSKMYRSVKAARAEAALARREPVSSASHPTVAIRWPSHYRHINAPTFANQFRDRLRRLTRFEFADIPQLRKSATVLFEADTPSGRYRIVLDFRDKGATRSLIAENCDLCFKMQFSAQGYAEEHILPGGYVLPRVETYLDLPELRKLADAKNFEFNVYGRFGTGPARGGADVRHRALTLLAEAGFPCFTNKTGQVSYRKFMQEIAQSKVAIDLPGNGALCFRLVQYLAVGTCVIAYPHANRLPVPLTHGEHIVYTKPDLSDLVQLCHHYVEHDEERDAIASQARRYFDQHLHRDRLVDYMLGVIEDRLA